MEYVEDFLASSLSEYVGTVQCRFMIRAIGLCLDAIRKKPVRQRDHTGREDRLAINEP
jgi:uncharacterized membrane protein required for colicin V production